MDGDIWYVYINTELISYIIVKHWQEIATNKLYFQNPELWNTSNGFYENPITCYRMHKSQPLANTALVYDVKYDLGLDKFIGNIYDSFSNSTHWAQIP
jgi:hypothetical protein